MKMQNFNWLQMKIREKGVLWCTQDGLRFLSCYKRVKCWKKAFRNFKKVSEIQGIQLFEDFQQEKDIHILVRGLKKLTN